MPKLVIMATKYLQTSLHGFFIKNIRGNINYKNIYNYREKDKHNTDAKNEYN